MEKIYLFFCTALAVAQANETKAIAPTTVSGPRTVFNIDATNTLHHTFFNLLTGKVVPLSDSATTNWHIAFKGTEIIINGGTSGPAGLSGQIVEGKTFENVLTAPASGYISDSPQAMIVPTGSGKGWYNYNQTNNTVTPINGKVIILKAATSTYAKIEILNYYKDAPTVAGGTSGFYAIRWLVNNNTNISQALTRVSNLYANRTHQTFFDLPGALEIPYTDSASTKWTMAFKTTNIYLNSGTSGPSNDQAQVLDGDFAKLLVAPTANYQKGNTAVPGGSGNGWYTYDITVHSIKPTANKIIAVKTANGRYAKIKILSYYKDNKPNPNFLDDSLSRYYTFEYLYQPDGTTDLDTLGSDVPVVVNGISELEQAKALFHIYPNPSQNHQLHLYFNQSSSEPSLLTIYNLSGTVIYTSPIAGEETLNQLDLTAGMYFVQVKQGSKISTEKLIIQ